MTLDSSRTEKRSSSAPRYWYSAAKVQVRAQELVSRDATSTRGDAVLVLSTAYRAQTPPPTPLCRYRTGYVTCTGMVPGRG